MRARQSEGWQIKKGTKVGAMKIFYLHANKVTVSSSRGRGLKGTEEFGTERELAELVAKWPMSHLHEVWNALPDTQPVRKFTDRKTGVRRIWKEIQKLKPVSGPRTRRATKVDQILALLKQPSGATLKSIMKATRWQAHSVRGFISGHLVRKMGLRVKSFRRDGERVYAIKR
jgi:Protein of unknown function (DUF3489)